MPKTPANRCASIGLFAGIGGLELGLHAAGFEPSLLCEIDPDASAVLAEKFPTAQRHSNIETLHELPPADVLCAGFPCQDLSMAGTKTGISGTRSGLVVKLFDLIEHAPSPPPIIVMENVPYMLGLDRGRAMRFLTEELNRLGYRWAYRVVDARAFGVPQRRLRVLLVACRSDEARDPRAILFSDDTEPQVNDSTAISKEDIAYGFYWTEGRRGLGWVVDGVPTIKGGSSIGIPSPPAIWDRPEGLLGTPDIRDLERLQGFKSNWTAAASTRARWRLVGNAVCVRVAEWLGSRILTPGTDYPIGTPCRTDRRWPKAAWGGPEERPHVVPVSTWPVNHQRQGLREFLQYGLKPLSERATSGYLARTRRATSLNFPPGFIEAVEDHLDSYRAQQETVS